MPSLFLQPISFKEANSFIQKHHRHHLPVQGWKFGIAVNDGSKVVGVITVGRPVAQHLDNGLTLEVNRCCTDGTPNACSKLYGAAWRAASALGYKRLITYLKKDELGISLSASGYRLVGIRSKESGWNTPGRPRVENPNTTGQKWLWEKGVQDA